MALIVGMDGWMEKKERYELPNRANFYHKQQSCITEDCRGISPGIEGGVDHLHLKRIFNSRRRQSEAAAASSGVRR